MRTSEKYATIMAALTDIQHAIDPVIKNKTVTVDGEKAKWSSAYATLGTLVKAIAPHLKTHKIGKFQDVGFVAVLGPVIITRLTLGEEWAEFDYPIKPTRDGAQGFGGGLAFSKRWALCGIFDIVPDDVEEGQGYKDAKAEVRQPRRAAAPAGLPDHLATIRDAETLDTFEAAARAARAKHPSGEASSAVELAIADKLVAVLDRLTSESDLDRLTAIKDRWQRLAPRGGDVRQALQRAAARVEPRP